MKGIWMGWGLPWRFVAWYGSCWVRCFAFGLGSTGYQWGFQSAKHFSIYFTSSHKEYHLSLHPFLRESNPRQRKSVPLKPYKRVLYSSLTSSSTRNFCITQKISLAPTNSIVQKVYPLSLFVLPFQRRKRSLNLYSFHWWSLAHSVLCSSSHQ